MSAQTYLDTASQTLARLVETEHKALAAAARLLADTIVAGGSLFACGASHSFLVAEELVYRTGGLMLFNLIYPHGMNLGVRPLTMTSRLERVPGLGRELFNASPAKAGDVLLVVSTSGRNPVAIDLALAARERGVKVIGITARAYSDAVASRHASGQKLAELCDLVLDNGAPPGDAAVAIAGFPQKIGPLSSVTGCALANALVAETVAVLVARGVTPPVFMSANLDGGDEFNARLLEENKDRIHYL